MAYDLECADLACVLDVGTDAGAGIVVPYPYYAECFRSVIRKFAQVHDGSGLFSVQKFDCDIKILSYDLIYLCLYFGHLLCSRLCIKYIVTLGLFLLHVGIPRTRTAEHLHHSSIQQMLSRMSRLVLGFIMCVQYRCFHNIFRYRNLQFHIAFLDQAGLFHQEIDGNGYEGWGDKMQNCYLGNQKAGGRSCLGHRGEGCKRTDKA